MRFVETLLHKSKGDFFIVVVPNLFLRSFYILLCCARTQRSIRNHLIQLHKLNIKELVTQRAEMICPGLSIQMREAKSRIQSSITQILVLPTI